MSQRPEPPVADQGGLQGEGPDPPGAVEPVHFGGGRLFGCLQVAPEGRAAVVVCQPFGHEYLTLHRALRQLATQIARRGITVLRFDYSGTGDSAGRLTDASLETWREEIGRALAFVRQRSGAETLGLVGVRLGGSLAFGAAREHGGIDALALWDPIVWGRSYLAELTRSDRRMRRRAHVVYPSKPRRDEPREILGFPVARSLEKEIRRLELDREPIPRVGRVLLLESRKAATAALGATLRANGSAAVETEFEPHDDLWSWEEDITRVELPHRSVRRLAAWMVESLA